MQRRGVVGEVGEDTVLRGTLVVHKVLREMLVHAERGGGGERLAGGAVEGPELLIAPDSSPYSFCQRFCSRARTHESYRTTYIRTPLSRHPHAHLAGAVCTAYMRLKSRLAGRCRCRYAFLPVRT